MKHDSNQSLASLPQFWEFASGHEYREKSQFWRRNQLAELGLSLNTTEASQQLTQQFPVCSRLHGAEIKISGGVVFTSDPITTREVLTVLAVGKDALARCRPESIK